MGLEQRLRPLFSLSLPARLTSLRLFKSTHHHQALVQLKVVNWAPNTQQSATVHPAHPPFAYCADRYSRPASSTQDLAHAQPITVLVGLAHKFL